jgi:hypothetical protein
LKADEAQIPYHLAVQDQLENPGHTAKVRHYETVVQIEKQGATL